jgi:iron complex outermembrane receptor protein
LTAALQSFAIASHHKLLYKAELTAGKTSRDLKGHFTAEEAIEALLSGTGLTFQITGSSVVLIRDQNDGSAGALRQEDAAPTTTDDVPSGANSPGDRAASRDSRFRPAQANQGVVQNSSAVGTATQSSTANSENSSRLEEILVTAQKRSERIQDVPVPLTVLKADTLAATGQALIRDYFTSVPGLTVTSGRSPGTNTLLTIRGVNSGGSSPTVGILIDDVPFGSTYGGHDNGDIPDIDPGDFDHVEVLRGPQGTLYGADSMGGLLKFVTVDPSTAGVSGRIEVGTSWVYNGAEPGYSFRGSINLPVSDTVAVRASGFERQDSGYIDNPVLHVDGVNQTQAYGGRLALLWLPSQDLSIKLSALYEHTKADGSPAAVVQRGLGDLQQDFLLGIGGYERTVQAYSATLSANLGNVNLTSVSGYNRDSSYHSSDDSSTFGKTIAKTYGANVSGAPIYNWDSIDKVTQEIRLSSSIGRRIDWLVGAYYTHEAEKLFQDLDGINPATGQVVAPGYYSASLDGGHDSFEEYAAFANLTYHFTDQFDVQVGGREGHFRYGIAETFIAFGGPPASTPPETATNSPFTYLITPRFKVSDDLMAYARFASGFRPGSPNSLRLPGVPGEVDPDTTKSSEVGLKANFFDHLLSVDSSLYYLTYNDLQLTLKTSQGLTYGGNGGQAKSEGVEFSVTLRPLQDTTLSAWIAYDDAALTRNFPASSTAYGVSGNRLPYSSRFSGNLSAQQKFRLSSNITGFVGGSVSYVGDREGELQATPKRQIYPAFTQTDLRAGMKYESWLATLYVKNAANVRGIIGGGLDVIPVNSFTYIQPRTVGLSLARTF